MGYGYTSACNRLNARIIHAECTLRNTDTLKGWSNEVIAASACLRADLANARGTLRNTAASVDALLYQAELLRGRQARLANLIEFRLSQEEGEEEARLNSEVGMATLDHLR